MLGVDIHRRMKNRTHCFLLSALEPHPLSSYAWASLRSWSFGFGNSSHLERRTLRMLKPGETESLAVSVHHSHIKHTVIQWKSGIIWWKSGPYWFPAQYIHGTGRVVVLNDKKTVQHPLEAIRWWKYKTHLLRCKKETQELNTSWQNRLWLCLLVSTRYWPALSSLPRSTIQGTVLTTATCTKPTVEATAMKSPTHQHGRGNQVWGEDGRRCSSTNGVVSTSMLVGRSVSNFIFYVESSRTLPVLMDSKVLCWTSLGSKNCRWTEAAWKTNSSKGWW